MSAIFFYQEKAPLGGFHYVPGPKPRTWNSFSSSSEATSEFKAFTSSSKSFSNIPASERYEIDTSSRDVEGCVSNSLFLVTGI